MRRIDRFLKSKEREREGGSVSFETFWICLSAEALSGFHEVLDDFAAPIGDSVLWTLLRKTEGLQRSSHSSWLSLIRSAK
jgi:hypothetical protein